MYLPIFSKRHKSLIDRRDISLNLPVVAKRRILYAMDTFNLPVNETNAWGYSWESDLISEVGQELVQEHGWEELRAFDLEKQEMVRVNTSDFLIRCAGHHAFDFIELYSRSITEERHVFHENINNVFRDCSLPWRLVDDMIYRVDSEYLAEVLEQASKLLTSEGFEGAFEEFHKAHAHLDSGDTKESIHHANLSLESTMKSILGVDREKPGRLIRRIIDSGIIPSYYDEFLRNFEQVLRAVNIARNEERGAGHGQGAAIEKVPQPLAELVLNLCGALTVYLVKQHRESDSSSPDSDLDDIPF